MLLYTFQMVSSEKESIFFFRVARVFLGFPIILNKKEVWDKLSDLVHWENLGGAGGEGSGRGDRDGEHM